MISAKKRKLEILHLNGILANFCCFITGDLSLLLPEPVLIYYYVRLGLIKKKEGQTDHRDMSNEYMICNVNLKYLDKLS